ncbi:MAG: hypothetical protein A2046_03605 [Bacteroidetes bacterium GWA2_30_7]|nr:MAG: hypothetical protein A2046_03605 [Bacteroidetes bacterium GWA2_30_7]
MTLINYPNLTTGLNTLNFNDLIDGFFDYTVEKLDYTKQKPLVNIYENDNSYKIEMALPGISKEQISINVEKNILTITSVNSDKTEDDKKIILKEFDYRNFEKKYTLSKDLDLENIVAKFENGIMQIEVPKKQLSNEVTSRKINIS